MTEVDPTLARHAAAILREAGSAIDWWQMAGVDCTFADDATALWAEPLPPAERKGDIPRAHGPAGQRGQAATDPAAPARGTRSLPRTPAAAPRRDLLGESPPQDLAAFSRWWMEAPGLDVARLHPRVPPRGPARAALMVLVADPEEADRDRLLGGPRGALLANILAAMGLAEDAAYVAAALPSHTPMADLAGLAAQGYDSLLAHHLALAAPQRLVAFGAGLEHLLAPGSEQPLREINQTSGNIPVMVTESLESMMAMPRLKARFWRRWTEWTAS